MSVLYVIIKNGPQLEPSVIIVKKECLLLSHSKFVYNVCVKSTYTVTKTSEISSHRILLILLD